MDEVFGTHRLIEVWFGIVERQAIRRGAFTSVKEFADGIAAFIDYWNDHAEPFAWTKDPDEILAKIQRSKTKQAPLQATRSVRLTPRFTRALCGLSTGS